MALEDAVTLGRALGEGEDDIDAGFALYQRSRVVLMTREMGRLDHAHGVERLVRNDLWRGRTPERFYDALEWLYGWTAERCLAR
jgi:salicylate hydroxylase